MKERLDIDELNRRVRKYDGGNDPESQRKRRVKATATGICLGLAALAFGPACYKVAHDHLSTPDPLTLREVNERNSTQFNFSERFETTGFAKFGDTYLRVHQTTIKGQTHNQNVLYRETILTERPDGKGYKLTVFVPERKVTELSLDLSQVYRLKVTGTLESPWSGRSHPGGPVVQKIQVLGIPAPSATGAR